MYVVKSGSWDWYKWSRRWQLLDSQSCGCLWSLLLVIYTVACTTTLRKHSWESEILNPGFGYFYRTLTFPSWRGNTLSFDFSDLGWLSTTYTWECSPRPPSPRTPLAPAKTIHTQTILHVEPLHLGMACWATVLIKSLCECEGHPGRLWLGRGASFLLKPAFCFYTAKA